MSQFQQPPFQQNQFQQPNGFQPPQQPGFAPQQNFQQQAPPVQVGYQSACVFEGQVYPSARLPNGFQFTQGTSFQQQSRLKVNLKLRKETFPQQGPSKVKISYVVIELYGQLADQFNPQLRMGQVIYCTAEYSTSEYESKQVKGQINTSQNFNVGKGNVFQIKGMAPLVQEQNTPKQNRGNYGQQQQYQQPYQSPAGAPQYGQPQQAPQQPQGFVNQPPAAPQQFQQPAQQPPAFQQPPQQPFGQPPQGGPAPFASQGQPQAPAPFNPQFAPQGQPQQPQQPAQQQNPYANGTPGSPQIPW